MNTELIYSIIVTIITLGLGFLSAYFKTRNKLADKVNEGIANAEAEYADTTKAGGEKFEYVINFLYEYIPSVLKPIFSRNMLSTIVQSAFDQIEDYAMQQLDKYVNKIEDKDEDENK